MNMENYTEINSRVWDRWSANGCEWSLPISHEEYMRAVSGEWGVFLATCIHVPKEWFAPYYKNSSLSGARLLGLASGGGQQMPIFSALGADCTILDYSDMQLEKERLVAEREGYKINIVKADMTKRLPFGDGEFDLIFHPVSNCYVEDVFHVWNECHRILKKGGVLLAGMDNGISFLFSEDSPLTVVNRLPYNSQRDGSEAEKKRIAENKEAVFFSHSLGEQLGGQLKAGFTITDLYEDRDREGGAALREYTNQYIVTRAVKL